MKKSLLLAAATAAMMAMSVSAQAGNSFSFEVNGKKVRVDVPRNCTSLSCISVSAPGLNFSDFSSGREDDAPVAKSDKDTTKPVGAGASAEPRATGAGTDVKPSAASQQVVPAAPAATAVEPLAQGAPPSIPAAPSASTEPAPATVAPPAPATPSSPLAQISGPLGIWVTEKNEGKVRIVTCGQNLCGYAINAKTGLDGEQVLINMKPVSDGKWSGRIKDTRGGGIYDSTVTMKGGNALRVQGCAFGGMFCGGQTWTRAI